jgi:DNA polymerase (family 10)
VRTNDEVAALLAEYAELLAITSGDGFRIRSYEKAARSVAGYPQDLARVDPAELDQIPNVGRAIAAKIRDYLSTGHIRQLNALRAKVPDGVRRLTEVPGLGPKRAMSLYTERGIDSVDELAASIAAGRLEGLPGFGPKSVENLLRGIELIRKSAGRVRIDTAMDLAAELITRLSAVPGCTRCAYAGSVRRMRDTIGDVDILAVAADPPALMTAFRELPLTAEVIASGDAKTSIRTADGIQADLRVVPEGSWGAALLYFTGSQAHNVRLREMAIHRGLKLSEYGLFDSETGACLAAATEDEVYERLGLPWIPPPLREDSGEIEAAQRGELPVLVAEADLRGDRHGGGGGGPRLRLLRGHRPCPEPVHAADDGREDAGPAGRGAPPGRAVRRDAATARHRAQHRPGRRGGLARGVPRRLRPVRGLGALALHPAARGDDPAHAAGHREPARGHPRPSHHPDDRPAPAGGRGPRGGVRGVRAHRHRDRD